LDKKAKELEEQQERVTQRAPKQEKVAQELEEQTITYTFPPL